MFAFQWPQAPSAAARQALLPMARDEAEEPDRPSIFRKCAMACRVNISALRGSQERKMQAGSGGLARGVLLPPGGTPFAKEKGVGVVGSSH